MPTSTAGLLHFRRPTVDDAAMLLAWRTDPRIAQYMYTEVEHDMERQRAWLTNLVERSDHRAFVIGSAGCWIGFLAYSSIDWHNAHCVAGSYVSVRDTPTRAASYLFWYVMDYAFHRLEMNKVISEVLDTNTQMLRSLRLLKQPEVGVRRQHVRKRDRFHDVYVFEMLREDWVVRPRLFPLDQTLSAFEVVP